ncbi:nitric oxide reductase NorE protein [Mycolicibacterium sp. BK556]|uniref:cytochrome c oxidase subunit 3 n=1 Tax=Mycobacteriaceae TaxID=1762 RepID=UPI0010622D44|nr:cytochrome c oxidase subunit 3 [Mycobacterium sp. BK086]MBB3606108.1 nitric oxide reductase NorE protein [Mycolicibacterium sp. BK556]MBB3632685.1 nitric oxide reductase NorE protein [Mycolicibacterium sp. BK607]MBB3754034.1 nitric oxide reductase NorE protein [Mycolicibacterium sp. BK634]TDO17990.1 nitric oxide reductase NorE protein [Mycobacterium sp. BK086]
MTVLDDDVKPTNATERRIPGEEGIWVFVLGDMTVFALFFATFMYSRGKNPQSFAAGHADLHVALGTVNTVLLLTSSLLVAIGVQRVLGGAHRDATRLFTAAIGCGAGFVGVKAIEWTQLFSAGKGVGSGEYFSYYFVFTGIHLMHVLIGMAILGRLVFLTRRPALEAPQRRLCETGGIFWHMVDLLWVVLFALFYLVR